MRRRDREALSTFVEFVTGGKVVHVNDGSSHQRMLAYNRRCDRAYARSRRNQPPRGRS